MPDPFVPPSPAPSGFVWPWIDPETGAEVAEAFHYISLFQFNARDSNILIRVDVHRTQASAYRTPVPRPMDSYNVEIGPSEFGALLTTHAQIYGAMALTNYAEVIARRPEFQPPPEPEPA